MAKLKRKQKETAKIKVIKGNRCLNHKTNLVHNIKTKNTEFLRGKQLLRIN